TYWCSASNCPCRPAAWATRSCWRPPSTVRWLARTRRRRMASPALRPSATTATAPDAIATIPVVLVSSCTGGSIGGSPERLRPRLARGPDALRPRREHLGEGHRERQRVVGGALLAGYRRDRGLDGLVPAGGALESVTWQVAC